MERSSLSYRMLSFDNATPPVSGDVVMWGTQRDRCTPDIRWSHIELSTKQIAEVGRTDETHGIGNFRDRAVGISRRPQQIVAFLQSPEPQPFRDRHVGQPE